jgi:dipeptidyl aminopeptidase/acylaminoacyl peptidase
VGADGLEPLTSVEAEIGGAVWEFGMSWYACLADGRIACTVVRDGFDHLAVLEASGELRDLDCGLSTIAHVAADGDAVVLVGATPRGRPRVWLADLDGGALAPLSEAEAEVLDPAYVSVPRPLDFPTTGGEVAHALFYPPVNPEFAGPSARRSSCASTAAPPPT